MKKFAAALLVLVAIIGAAVFWLSGNIDGLIKSAIENYGSAMTQAKVSVDEVRIAPVDGKGTLGNLVIGNPAGFKTPHAMKVGRIDVDIDITSVTKDVVVIHRIAIVAPDLNYEMGSAITNFDAIQKNIASFLGPAGSKEDKAGTRLIVGELTIRQARAQASAALLGDKRVSVALPDITLKNLGKARGGITPGELGQEVVKALTAKLGSAVNFDRLLKSSEGAAGKAGSTLKGLFK
jgi:hypothetical protein